MAVVIHEFEVQPSSDGGAGAPAAAAKSAAKQPPVPQAVEAQLRLQNERAQRVRAH
jgi:hypothetical protein